MLERNPSDPNGLDADNDGVACEVITDPDGGDVDCKDFPTQQAAQRELAKDRTDPNNLDADGDGRACEELIGEGVMAQRPLGNSMKRSRHQAPSTVPRASSPAPASGGCPLREDLLIWL